MDRHGWRWPLGVALLLGSVSSGLGAVPAGHAATLPALASPLGRGTAWGRPDSGRAPATGPASPPLGSSGSITWTQQAELTSTAQMPNDAFAQAVALGGNTAVVGAPFTPPMPGYGAAYVFERTGSTWSQQAALTDPGNVQNDRFGWAVAVNRDTAVIGAPGETGAAAASGTAYVYGRSGGTWSPQAVLTATDGAAVDGFGDAVAISGTTIVVGAPGKDNGAGAVYLFVRVGGVWQQQAEFLDPTHTAFAQFGYAVAVSGDTALVAAVQEPEAYVYVRSGGVWALQGVLHAAHPPGTYFGISVALSGDTALVGACCDVLGRQTGAVYVFGRSGGTWALLASIPPPPGSDGNPFGQAVALDGHTALIGGVGVFAYVGGGGRGGSKRSSCPAICRPMTLAGRRR